MRVPTGEPVSRPTSRSLRSWRRSPAPIVQCGPWQQVARPRIAPISAGGKAAIMGVLGADLMFARPSDVPTMVVNS